jgi:hypothetical protein
MLLNAIEGVIENDTLSVVARFGSEEGNQTLKKL